MTHPVASMESKQRTAALLTDLWARNQPLIGDRLAILEKASAGPITEIVRVEAVEVAHKLAGSLGMFGFDKGTDIARELEILLQASPPDIIQVAALTARLRSVLFP